MENDLLQRFPVKRLLSSGLFDRIARGTKLFAGRGKNAFPGEERELSVMFTDIRGFSDITERLGSRQVMLLLNKYFAAMTDLVRKNSGTPDKFIGDGLMAFWNAPSAVKDHPVLAVETALRMQEEVAILNRALKAEFGCAIRMGAGVHTGRACVGNVGEGDLAHYTPIGADVNLASRLVRLCSRFEAGTIVSSATRQYCLENAPGGFFFWPLATVRVKGRARPVSLYAVLRPGAAKAREKEFALYTNAAALYLAGDFAGAAGSFAALREEYPGVALYSLYLERISRLKDAPPEKWDGVWTFAAT